MDNQYTGRLLIVDDEAELRFILSAHLRASGFEVFEAADGAKAIALAIEHKPDIIIMDVGLAMMDGIVATRALKAHVDTASIPVIMLTARSRPEDVVRGLEAGAQEYVLKPFDVTELLARVRTVHRLAIARKDLDRLNTQLEAEVDVKTRRLQLLYDYTRELNRSDNRDRILDLVVRCVEEMTGASRVSLFLTDSVSQKLICERASGVNIDDLEPLDISATPGITGQVFRSGKTLTAQALSTGSQVGHAYNRDAFVSTPLVTTSLETRDGTIGVLNVTEKSSDAPFSEEEVEGIRSIADAAAIALEGLTRRNQLQHSVRVLLQTVGHLAEFRDEETTLHIERVSRMARILGERLQREGPYRSVVTDGFVEHLVQAAPMHDIGKVGIPDEILTKPGKLTMEEFQIMKTHADIGRRVLSRALDPAHPVPLLRMCIDIAYCHHERYDGNGYPRRISGEDIPLSARIIALVDAYDAITSERRYKAARSHEEAVTIIRSEAGKHFDPVLVEAFLNYSERFDEVRAKHAETPESLEASRVPAT